MKIQYYPETDSLYIDLADKPGTETREAAPGVNLDFDEQGRLVGIDIDNAKNSVNLTTFDIKSLPISSMSVCG